MSVLNDHFIDGSIGLLKDMCPFTILGIFNRGLTDKNRQLIAKELATFFKLDIPAPETFLGIPVLNNQQSWFFAYENKREKYDIDKLWDFFETAINFSDEQEDNLKSTFINKYDEVNNVRGVGWNITMGLYWIRPWFYLTLDSRSQKYISERLGFEIRKSSPKGRCTGTEYISLLDEISTRFKEEAYPAHSFPELSLNAWKSEYTSAEKDIQTWKSLVYQKIKELCEEKNDSLFSMQEFLNKYQNDFQTLYPSNNTIQASLARNLQLLRDEDLIEFLSNGQYQLLDYTVDSVEEFIALPIQHEPYNLESIISDGCFLETKELKMILERLYQKKNIILQGPPGTGKTWLAKRLGYALIGFKNDEKLKAVQFHANLSYEDFVRGWRPSAEGKLALIDGPILEIISAAKKDAETKHVIIIEEINRGNPAQIFGEMLTLLEADKRTPSEALELSYRRNESERFFIPNNLYVIGTMNIADRSLALVDLALMRRFAFISLKPTFGQPWRNWVHEKSGIDMHILESIEQRILKLNSEIESDKNLGPQFKIGHSYVTPAFSNTINDPLTWYKGVVSTEIAPLLSEYWFNDPDQARKAKEKLVEGL
ncbi:MAG: AAA family ATPase [Pseudomonadota bacterium]